MLGRIAALDVGQLKLLVDVDHHVPSDHLRDPAALDFARLKDHVAVGKNGRRTPGGKLPEHGKPTGVEPLFEGIIDQE